MSLRETVAEQMKVAMKSGAPDSKLRVSTLRMLMAELKNAEIAKRGELAADDELAVVAREVKRRTEAVDEYAKAGRDDLAGKEETEASILKEFLPEQLSEAEVESIVDEAIAETGAATPKDMGRVMGAVMPKLKGRADGKLVNALVARKLGAG